MSENQWFGLTAADGARIDASVAFGDGLYEFYSAAEDAAGNIELPPDAPDARTRVHTTGATEARRWLLYR